MIFSWPGPPLTGNDLLVLIRALDHLESAARLATLPFADPDNAQPLLDQMGKIRRRLVHAYGTETRYIPPPGEPVPPAGESRPGDSIPRPHSAAASRGFSKEHTAGSYGVPLGSRSTTTI